MDEEIIKLREIYLSRLPNLFRIYYANIWVSKIGSFKWFINTSNLDLYCIELDVFFHLKSIFEIEKKINDHLVQYFNELKKV